MWYVIIFILLVGFFSLFGDASLYVLIGCVALAVIFFIVKKIVEYKTEKEEEQRRIFDEQIEEQKTPFVKVTGLPTVIKRIYDVFEKTFILNDKIANLKKSYQLNIKKAKYAESIGKTDLVAHYNNLAKDNDKLYIKAVSDLESCVYKPGFINDIDYELFDYKDSFEKNLTPYLHDEFPANLKNIFRDVNVKVCKYESIYYFFLLPCLVYFDIEKNEFGWEEYTNIKLDNFQTTYRKQQIDDDDEVCRIGWAYETKSGRIDLRYTNNYQVYYIYDNYIDFESSKIQFSIEISNREKFKKAYSQIKNFMQCCKKYLSEVELSKYLNDNTRSSSEMRESFIEEYTKKFVHEDFEMTDTNLDKYYGENIDVILPDNVYTLSDEAFMDTKIHSIEFTRNIETLPNRVFSGCEYLKEISGDLNFSHLYDEAFRNCKSLRTLGFKLPNIINTRTFLNCVLLDKLDFSNVTDICKSAFENCRKLTTIDENNKIQLIGPSAFKGCKSLNKIWLYNVKEIGADAFLNCNNLRYIRIGEKLVETNLSFRSFSGIIEIEYKSLCCFENYNSYFDKYKIILNYKPGNIKLYDMLYTCGFNQSLIGFNYLEPTPKLEELCLANSLSLEKVKLNQTKIIDQKAFISCAKLKEVDTSDSNITMVNDYAFYDCKNLEKIKLSDNIKYIGHGAFEKCCNLKQIGSKTKTLIINDGMTVFRNSFSKCLIKNMIINTENITDVIIEIASRMEIEEIEVPDSIKFEYYNKLVNLPSMRVVKCYPTNNLFIDRVNVLKIPYNLKKLDINNGITKIELEEATSLVSQIKFPIFMETIDETLLQRCPELTKVYCNKKVKNKKELVEHFPNIKFSYYNVSGRSEINYPEDEVSFEDFYYVKKININKDCTELKDQAFKNFNNVVDLKINDKITKLGKECFMNCSSIKEMSIPYSITEITEDAFSGCAQLEKIEIPGSVTKICARAFKDCHNLKEIIGMDKVEIIEDSAFENCFELESLVFPRSLIKFNNAVINCKKLTRLIFTHDMELCSLNLKNLVKLKEILLPQSIGDLTIKNAYNCTAVISCLRGCNWNKTLNTTLQKNYIYKSDYIDIVNKFLLENGYTVAYTEKKIRFKKENNIDFDFSNDAFNNSFEEEVMPVEKKRASFDTVLVKEGTEELNNELNESINYSVEKINIDNSIDVNSTEEINNEFITFKNDNLIASNLFNIILNINKGFNKLIITFVNKNGEIVVDKSMSVLLNNSIVEELNISFELNKIAENGKCYCVIFNDSISKENILCYKKFNIDRLFEISDDFGIF